MGMFLLIKKLLGKKCRLELKFRVSIIKEEGATGFGRTTRTLSAAVLPGWGALL